MSALIPQAQTLKTALKEWLDTLGLEVAEVWFLTPEEFFGDDLAGYASSPELVMTFDSDLHDILWSWVSGDSKAARQHQEFNAIVKAHGFVINKKDYTTIYFTREHAVRGDRERELT